MSPVPAHLSSDPVPPLARAVMTLFAEALPDVRFPDLDLAVLESAADDLRAAQVELEQIEAELHAARAALAKQAEQLTTRAQRALAYARVYAEGDPELASRVQAVAGSPKAGTLAGEAPKRRGRPRRQAGAEERSLADASLFALESAHSVEGSC